MLFTSFGNVFGATNPSYTADKTIDNSALDAKIQDSILLDVLANMINAIASLAESLIGGVFSTLTGENIFPWADRIIFNAIPFLDINFLNPDSNSLFGSGSSETILGRVVKQVYSTIFSLAVLFLGVAVGVMAIRLAISSIAAEKAKYKQAIVNWATCLVMLFLMHYILAFVFWINEQMVQIASEILINTIKKENINDVSLKEALDNIINAKERVQLFNKAAYGTPDAASKVLEDNADIANNLINDDRYLNTYFSRHMLEDDASGNFNLGKQFSNRDDRMGQVVIPRMAADTLVAKEIADLHKNNKNSYDNQYENGVFKVNISGQTNDWNPPSEQYLFVKADAFKNNSYYKKYLAYTLTLALWKYKNSSGDAEDVADVKLWDDYRYYKIKPLQSKSYFESNWNEEKVDNYISTLNGVVDLTTAPKDLLEYFVANCSVKDMEEMLGSKIVNDMINNRITIDMSVLEAAGVISTSKSAENIIANLGEFFKKSAYIYETETKNEDGDVEKVTGWRATKLSVTGALLYGIFIFQSCMYFIMYVKRLFYVMMLSMFGPIVVVYDFFMKSAG